MVVFLVDGRDDIIGVMKQAVLILNASYEPIQVVPLQHAITMLYREVAVIEEADSSESFGPYPLPKILRLIKYVKVRWQHRQMAWSRGKLLARDKYRCGYCGGHAKTVDHIVPISRGGTSTWENTIAACLSCNGKKSNRLLIETNLALLFQPTVPTLYDIHHGFRSFELSPIKN